MEKFSLTLPLMGEYLTTVRLTTGGLCALVGFDVETAEDYKVCVTESLLILKRNGFSSATITFMVGEALACEVQGDCLNGDKEESIEEEISRALLSALLGDVEFIKDKTGSIIEKIVFEG
jgi:hypothetical protein